VEIPLNTVGRVIARCWNSAEDRTSKVVALRYSGPTEEHITFLFAGELRASVKKASSSGEFDRAFMADLRSSIPDLDYNAEHIFSGLVARVNFHNRRHEGSQSASDLGIVIRRPVVRLDHNRTYIDLSLDHSTGLLAQAKRGAYNGAAGAFKWGRFTKAQQLLFPKHSNYYSLLLYRLSGGNADQLEHFRWQLCKNYPYNDIKRWLLSDRFPAEISSSEVIRRLFARKIGTENSEVIRNIIDPKQSGIPIIDLQILWPDDSTPLLSTQLRQRTRQVQHVFQR